MKLLERNTRIAERIDNLSPLVEPIREILINGKRQQLLSGNAASGAPFAPLAQSTLKMRAGGGPPLAPLGEASEIIARYTVVVGTEPTRIRVTAGWPGVPWVRYHVTGGRRLPRRDPSGFRQEDLAAVRTLLRQHVMDK